MNTIECTQLGATELTFIRAALCQLRLSAQEGLHFLWLVAEVPPAGLFIHVSPEIALPMD